MSNYLIDNLKALMEENLISFHVPGHKNGRIIKEYYNKYFSDILKIDTTEIPGTDNLHKAEAGILNSQIRVSRLYKSKKSYILVNGTTSGILSMILAATEPNDKILVAKNCHKSIYNGILLGNLNPVFIEEMVDKETGIILDISLDEIEKKLLDNPEIRAVIITYPTYNGICSDISGICDLMNKYNKILLVDEAHGAHLPLSEELPFSSIDFGADIVVQSTHKSLPSFTQSSVLHVNSKRVDIGKLEMMLSTFQSSSPSYILMSSIDIAMEIFENCGQLLMKELIENINWFKDKLHLNTNFRMIDRNFNGFNKTYGFDITKINIVTTIEGYLGYEIEKILRNNFHIQIEFSTERIVLLLASISNNREDFEKLLEALISISGYRKPVFLNEINVKTFSLERKISMNKAFHLKGDIINIDESIGCVSLDFIIPYPPGVPIITPGEVITREIVEYMKILINNGCSVIGLSGENSESIRIFRG